MSADLYGVLRHTDGMDAAMATFPRQDGDHAYELFTYLQQRIGVSNKLESTQ